MSLVSDIKLIRTDTTLDLSQKAEKGMLLYAAPSVYIVVISSPPLIPTIWDNEVHLTEEKPKCTGSALVFGSLSTPSVSGEGF